MNARWTPQDLAEYRARNPIKHGDLDVEIQRDAENKPASMLIGFSESAQLSKLFDCQIQAVKLPAPTYEYRFMPPRRFRFDFAWPEMKVAFEIEGGTWSGGRHVRGNGYASDCVKYSEAAILGWKVIRATSEMVKSGVAIDLLKRAIGASR